MSRFGVSVDDDLLQQIEELRTRTDPDTGEREIATRSAVIEELLRIGLEATEVIEQADDLDIDPGRPRAAYTRQALLNEINREFDEE